MQPVATSSGHRKNDRSLDALRSPNNDSKRGDRNWTPRAMTTRPFIATRATSVSVAVDQFIASFANNSRPVLPSTTATSSQTALRCDRTVSRLTAAAIENVTAMGPMGRLLNQPEMLVTSVCPPLKSAGSNCNHHRHQRRPHRQHRPIVRERLGKGQHGGRSIGLRGNSPSQHTPSAPARRRKGSAPSPLRWDRSPPVHNRVETTIRQQPVIARQAR